MAGLFASNFFASAARPTSGAERLLTRGAAAIAGLAGAMHDAERARDMRSYPFWAQYSAEIGTYAFLSPER